MSNPTLLNKVIKLTAQIQLVYQTGRNNVYNFHVSGIKMIRLK